MEILIITHAINIVFAGSIGMLLLLQHSSMEKNFGWDSPARQMFASVYIAITLASIIALVIRPIIDDVAMVLFPLQIIYTLLCFITVSSKKNSMLWANFLLAAILAMGFISMFRPIFGI